MYVCLVLSCHFKAQEKIKWRLCCQSSTLTTNHCIYLNWLDCIAIIIIMLMMFIRRSSYFVVVSDFVAYQPSLRSASFWLDQSRVIYYSAAAVVEIEKKYSCQTCSDYLAVPLSQDLKLSSNSKISPCKR